MAPPSSRGRHDLWSQTRRHPLTALNDCNVGDRLHRRVFRIADDCDPSSISHLLQDLLDADLGEVEDPGGRGPPNKLPEALPESGLLFGVHRGVDHPHRLLRCRILLGARRGARLEVPGGVDEAQPLALLLPLGSRVEGRQGSDGVPGNDGLVVGAGLCDLPREVNDLQCCRQGSSDGSTKERTAFDWMPRPCSMCRRRVSGRQQEPIIRSAKSRLC